MKAEIPMKTCTKCNEELALFEFGYSPTKNYHFPQCKKCMNAQRKRWYKKDPNAGSNHVWRRGKKIYSINNDYGMYQ